MRWLHMLTILIPVGCVVFFFVLGCSTLSPRHEVVRDVNAAWSEDGQKLLLIESRYVTSRPEEPHFNATSAREWNVVLYRVPRPASPGTIGRSGREKIGAWKETASPGGSIMYSPVYWLEKRKRLIAMQNQRPVLYNFESGRLMELDVPMDVKREMVGPRMAEGVFGRGATPSPDGRLIGVLYTIGFSKKAGIAQLHFRHFMAFFDAETGAHLRSKAIQWPDDVTDLDIVPRADAMPKRYRFLWNKNSDGVYLASGGRAFLVPVAAAKKIKPAKQLPAHAVATPGGPVSDRGEFVYLAENQASPNRRELRVRVLKDWVPFRRVPLVNATKAEYAR